MTEEQPTLNEAAVALNEMFLSLLKGGFTEAQALTIVSNFLMHSMDTWRQSE